MKGAASSSASRIIAAVKSSSLPAATAARSPISAARRGGSPVVIAASTAAISAARSLALLCARLPSACRSATRSSGALARGIVDRLALLAVAAPRIASVAYTAADLPAGGEWLTTSQAHPWPEVRSAALARVTGPCSAPVVKQLAKIADATGRHGEAEAIVAREAIAALGRCGGDPARRALTDLLDAADQDGDRRAEAGRQLVKHFGSAGADAAAAALNRTPDSGLAIRLLRALQRSDAVATPTVREALCGATEAVETAAAARQAIAALLPGEDAPCGERSAPERPDPEKPRVYMQ